VHSGGESFPLGQEVTAIGLMDLMHEAAEAAGR